MRRTAWNFDFGHVPGGRTHALYGPFSYDRKIIILIFLKIKIKTTEAAGYFIEDTLSYHIVHQLTSLLFLVYLTYTLSAILCNDAHIIG